MKKAPHLRRLSYAGKGVGLRQGGRSFGAAVPTRSCV